MSLDGAKIIDGDLANDIYNDFMSLYDEGYEIEEIKSKIEEYKLELRDDLEQEIYLTVFAQALWEVGENVEDLRLQIEDFQRSNKAFAIWNKVDKNLAEERKKVIGRFLNKISVKRKSPRPRKKYRKIKNAIFATGDLLSLESKNKKIIVLMAGSFQNGNSFVYKFAFCKESFDEAPNETRINRLEFFGRKIPSSLTECGFELGLEEIFVEHSDLVKIKNEFAKFGHVELDKEKYGDGSFSYSSSTEEIIKDYDRISSNSNELRYNISLGEIS